MTKSRLRHHFDRAAPRYDHYAGVQREVASRLLERLEWVRTNPKRVMDLGAGTGEACAGLQKHYPEAQIIAADFSPAMLREAQRLERASQLVASDALALPFAAESMDLVFSSSTLQWCDPLAQALQEIRRVLRAGGLLMFATYGPDTLSELRQAQQAIGLEGGVNDFIDMHPIGDLLLEQGYQDPVLDTERLDVSYSSVRDLAQELKGIGSSRMEQKTDLPALRRFWSALEKAYPRHDDGRIHATYEIIYGYALAPSENLSETDTVAVPLSAVGRKPYPSS